MVLDLLFKAGSSFGNIEADDLGASVLEFVLKSSVNEKDVDEIIGNVAQPSKAANIARVIALRQEFQNMFQHTLFNVIVLQEWRLFQLQLIRY